MERVRVWLKLGLRFVKRLTFLTHFIAKITPFLKRTVWAVVYVLAVLILLFLFGLIMLLANNLGITSKTLWDLMELLLVPAALTGAGLWFTNVQKKTELDIALEKQRQQTLENYFDKMKELILDNGLSSEAEEKVKRVAKILTINVLRNLDAERNKLVTRFLQGYEKATDEERVVSLRDADLRGAALNGSEFILADMVNANLEGANLKGALLWGAILERAKFGKANLRNADLTAANLEGSDFVGISKLASDEMYYKYLDQQDTFPGDRGYWKFIFSKSNVKEPCLDKENWEWSDITWRGLEWADMKDACLRGANLKGAFISVVQLSKARLSDSTIMPDGKTYKEWKQTQEQSEKQPPDIKEMRERLSESKEKRQEVNEIAENCNDTSDTPASGNA